MFGPYTPLQQLDVLADFGTKSYIVGSTNSLLLQQRDRYSDILINLDEDSVNITSTSLKAALQLSSADRRWMDFITQSVNETWDEANPGRPKTLGYVGSEEFIRLQFEEYLLALISSVKYHNHLIKHRDNPRVLLPHIEGDPSIDYNPDFVEAWKRTENYRIWNTHTDSHLFDIVEPKHPCAGGLTIDDVQRRITQQVQDLHLDERFAVGREVLGRNLAAGREKASTMFNKLYADMESLREAQRKRAEEAKQQQNNEGAQGEKNGNGGADATKAPQAIQSVGVKAGAFVNSWAAWAGEKRKAAGWGRASSSTSDNQSNNQSNRASGWGSGWGKSSGNSRSSYARMEKEGLVGNNNDGGYSPRVVSGSSTTSSTAPSETQGAVLPEQRAPQRGSLSGESMIDAAGSESGMSSPVSPRRRPLAETVMAPAASTPVIDAVVSAAVAVEENKARPQNGMVADGANPVQPAENKDTAAALQSNPTEEAPTPPLTPVPVVAIAKEAAEAQDVWGR